MHGTGRQQAGQEGRDRRKAPSGKRADRHEAVHVRRALDQRRQSVPVEAGTGNGQNRRRQHELDDPACLLADCRDDEMVKRRHHVPAHGEHEDRQREKGGNRQVPLECGLLGRLALRLFALCRVQVLRNASIIPGVLDGGENGLRVECPGHIGPLGGQIDIGARHARNRLKGALHAPGAGGAGHALDGDGKP